MEPLNQERVRDLLEKIYSLGKIPHALLFHGPQGVGKSTFALSFGKGVLCLKEKVWGCGDCSSCREFGKVAKAITSGSWEGLAHHEEKEGKRVFLYLTGEHPDFIYVPPSRNSVKIDQIRAVKEFANLKPVLSRKKLIVIDDADTMTKEASNALLKVLEEPPVDTYFILIAHELNALLPTVLSRVQGIEFPPLEEGAFYKLVGKKNRELYELSQGSITRAKLLEDKLDITKMVSDFLTLEPVKVFNVASKIDKLDEEEKRLFIELLESHIERKLLLEELNYDRFEMLIGRLGELRSGISRGIKLGLGLVSLRVLWR